MLKLKSLFYNPTRVFDEAAGDNANKPNVDGGGTGEADKAGGGGGEKKDDAASKKPETYTVPVDGEDREYTLEELKTHTSHVAGADKRFQEAAAATKAAERGTRVEALVKSISTGEKPSEADVRELAGLLEIEPTEFMQYLNESPPQDKTTPKAGVEDFNEQFKKAMGGSPAEVRAIIEHSQNRHVEAARQEIREISDKAVDKDEIIGKMIVGEGKDKVALAVKDMVAEDVLRKISDGKPFGAELVTESVQRVRSQLTKLGIPNKLNQQPIVLGLSPSAGLPADIQADEPIKRVSSTEDANESNLVARYMQRALKDYRQQNS